MKPWFQRWKSYEWSVAGHIAQGAASGAMAAYGLDWGSAVWSVGFWLYQFGSAARKYSEVGHCDSVGYDSFDFVVGFVPVYVAARRARAALSTC